MKRRTLPMGTIVTIPGGGQFTVDATEVDTPDGPRTVTVKILAREAAEWESGARCDLDLILGDHRSVEEILEQNRLLIGGIQRMRSEMGTTPPHVESPPDLLVQMGPGASIEALRAQNVRLTQVHAPMHRELRAGCDLARESGAYGTGSEFPPGSPEPTI
jgi:hypothetical protein